MSQGTRQGDAARVVVVGAGVTGLLAAVRCVLAGHRVVLVERGSIPHPGSTSFDQHRALRALAAGDPVGTSRSAVLHSRWRELDELLRDHLSGAHLYRRVGVMTALPPDAVAPAVATAEATGLPVRFVDPADYPHVGFPSDSEVLLEPRAGVLLADRVLHAATRWLRRHPLADLRPGTEVVAVRPDGRVRLADGTTESGDVVLLTAGPWSAALVDLPVTLHCQTMVYLRPPPELAHTWASTPIAGGIGTDATSWLLPSVAGTLLKISTDAVRREVTALTDPGADEPWTDRVLAAAVVSEVDRYRVVRARHCHYATAADGETGFVQVGPAVWARPTSGGAGFRTAPQAVDAVLGPLLPSTPRDTP
ncbi:FAD-dependent oxidoreductase [Actinokineospora cianjurensis]|uniref:Glycine/D-amino acid oxidase-like deaminating enzyme n=1 Tax=Actinokineospora cianjurensis TaxID=585224 RepID=A0A421AUX9_9PSEU|nr:FAD-dependent oxidoreductase [Actinokineospora cianjurensis]RLK53899.1 glycine/D-amino acid oxidase-like deaminating enzyme [Actinokineospora cianjurensis]